MNRHDIDLDMKTDKLILNLKWCHGQGLECVFDSKLVRLREESKSKPKLSMSAGDGVANPLIKYTILKRQELLPPNTIKTQKLKLDSAVVIKGSRTITLPPESEQPISIFLVEAASFNLLVNKKEKDTQIFSMIMKEIETALQNKTGTRTSNTSSIDVVEISFEEIMSKLLIEYRDLKETFNKTRANELSPHRPYDVKIELEDNTSQLSRSRVYLISKFKLQKLKAYLNDNLKKGFISPSHAPFASPVLFALKSNDDLRVCIDYRKLNALTKRNRYSIPLIEKTLAKVIGCKYLTKLDVIAAFNKLRMHSNSEELITFITFMRVYKYHVLPFKLTNDSTNYQHYMNDVL